MPAFASSSAITNTVSGSRGRRGSRDRRGPQARGQRNAQRFIAAPNARRRRNSDSTPRVFSPVFAHQERPVSQRELVKPHEGDKGYQRRDSQGQFSDSDDQSRSLG